VDLAIVIPVLNEAESLAPLLDEIAVALNGQTGYEILVVDDGSSDATCEVLSRRLERRPALRWIRHRNRCGQSAAIASGVEAARADWVVTLDGDGQNDPADLPKLIAVRDSADAAEALPWLIAGRRAKRRDTWTKRVASRIANAVRSALLGDATPDTGCGLKLFERDTFLQLPFFDHMHRFLPALMLRQGGRVISVPVRHRPRLLGRSHYGVWNRLWVGLVDLIGVSWLRRRMRLTAVQEPVLAAGKGDAG